MAAERQSLARPSAAEKKATQTPQAQTVEDTGPVKRVTIFENSDKDEDEDGAAPMPGGFGASSTKQVVLVASSDAERKRLDAAKAKKRSSVGRKSLGRASIVGTSGVTGRHILPSSLWFETISNLVSSSA